MKTLKISALILALTAFGVFATGCNGDDDTPDGGGNPDATTGGMDARADATTPPDTGTPDMGFPDTGPNDTGVDAGMEGEEFIARLTGAEENPAVATAAAGNVDFELLANGTLNYTITLNGLTPSAAHIHTAPAGQNGGVAHPLDHNALMGSVMLTAEQQADLRAGRLYVNVHTMANPGGEIRGQILRPGESLFVARLSGAEEVPANTATTSGTLSVILNAAANSIHYELSHNAPAVAAHIHRAAAGVNGPVVVPLDINDLSGDVAVTPAQVAGLRGGLWYGNVHTMRNPGGEIRGQLLQPGAQLFVANLTAAQEVPPTVALTTGRAQVIRNYAGTELSYWVTTNATVSAAHIHAAPGGVNGPVVVPLGNFMGGVSQGTAVTTATGSAGLDRGTWYVNIHTMTNPGGEIRGQLLRIGEVLYTAILAGTNEVPPNNSMGTGGFGLIVNAARDARGNGRATNLSGAIAAAHIHAAPIGMNGGVVQALTVNGNDLSVEMTLSEADLMTLNNGGWYVNVHTMMFAGGEVRGQLERK